MTRRPANPDQMNLWFEIPAAPQPTGGSLDYDAELRHTLSHMLAQCGASRYDVAAEMSRLLGCEVTKHQLDSWTAESREPWRFPFGYAAAIETATKSYALTELLTRKRGCRAYYGREAVLMELGKLDQQEEEMRRKRATLKGLLKDGD